MASRRENELTPVGSPTEGRKEKDVDTRPPSLSGESDGPIFQNDGVTKIEALYVVFGKGPLLVLLWASIFLVAYVFSIQSTTTGVYLQFATSTFGRHAMLGTIKTLNFIIAAVIKPILAKLCDLTSRPFALSVGIVFFTVGYIVVASSQSVNDLAGGEVLYTIGTNCLGFVRGLLVADLTSLQNRGLVNGLMFTPFIPNGFISGYIVEGIGGLKGETWRWGYGMFTILVPVFMAPAVIVLFWGQRRAQRLGALAIADPGYAARQEAEKQRPRKSILQVVSDSFWEVDVLGLLLLAFALGCFLIPFSLAAGAKGGYKNPSMIALLVVGVILAVCFGVYESKFAPCPIMPRRVLNRSLVCACMVNFFYWFSYYVNGIYQDSWVYVVTDWSDRDYTFWTNTVNSAICTFGVVVGVVLRFTHRYKYAQLFGLCLRIIGMIMSFAYTYKQHDALIVLAPILVGTGAAFISIPATVAAQGSVPHADLAIASAILALITSIGGACGGAVASAIWTQKLPQHLGRIEGFTAANVTAIYSDIYTARAAEPRADVVRAYLDTAWYMELPAFLIAFLSIVFNLATVNFRLGTAHNTVEADKQVILQDADETTDSRIAEKAAAAKEAARAKLGKDLSSA